MVHHGILYQNVKSPNICQNTTHKYLLVHVTLHVRYNWHKNHVFLEYESFCNYNLHTTISCEMHTSAYVQQRN
jgi:hypothetical protein